MSLLAMFLAVTVLLLVHLSLVTCAYVSAAACHRSEVEKDMSAAPVDSCGPAATSVPTDEESVSSVAVVHRKHKKIHRSAAAAAAASTATLPESSVASETQVPMAPVNPYRKPANPYVAYRNIKMKVNYFILKFSNRFMCNLVNRCPQIISFTHYLITLTLPCG